MPISLKDRNGEFLFRVSGVLLQRNKILLHKTKKGDGWVLPGGKAEINEKSEATIVRELEEELGLRVKVNRLLWIIESYNAYGVSQLHEHGLYYLIEAVNPPPEISEDEFYGLEQLGIRFKWFALDELSAMTIYPGVLSDLIRTIPTEGERIKHVINNDLEK